MTATFALELVRQALQLALMVMAPLLVTILAVGVVIGLLQAVTQLQEQTLTFVPKLVAVAAVLLFTLPWMLRELVQFLAQMLRTLPTLAT